MDHRAIPQPPPRTVVALSDRTGSARGGHEFATLTALAQRIARLQRLSYTGCTCSRRSRHAYYVPENTLTAAQAARRGIRCARDLYGGVVPHPFVATKVVTHPAIDRTETPAGWVDGLGEALGDAVLPGYAVFSRQAARRAHAELSPLGPLRLKLACATGGRGQYRIPDADALERALDDIETGELESHGATLELELRDAATYSIGMIESPQSSVCYVGRQHTTRNKAGEEVYGGSDLWVALGGFDALRGTDLWPQVRDAVARAQAYDRAMHRAYPGLFASRRNYDVVRGLDAAGVVRTGVLEQSWRIGGASPAEIQALRAFSRDPSLRLVRTSCREVHGEHRPPDDSDVHYRGHDPRWGLITKYSRMEGHGHPA